ncbi:hypothetical protein KKB83_00320 [Patescibacteria group bacterium]|nr:hypothetical protein [Patescibacteria group bacterium]
MPKTKSHLEWVYRPTPDRPAAPAHGSLIARAEVADDYHAAHINERTRNNLRRITVQQHRAGATREEFLAHIRAITGITEAEIKAALIHFNSLSKPLAR